MATIKGENYSFKQPSLSNGDVLEKCNFTQLLPNTKIANGKTGLIFKDCNLTNCDIPTDATTEKSLKIQKSFCFHLHPEWTLSAEPDACPHVTETDIITIDGQTMTIYTREDSLV